MTNGSIHLSLIAFNTDMQGGNIYDSNIIDLAESIHRIVLKYLPDGHEPTRELIYSIPESTSEIRIDYSESDDVINESQFHKAKGSFEEEETTIDDADSENKEHQSLELKKILENMMASEQYRDAYNMCLAAIKRDKNNEYALKKIDELVPLLKGQAKKDKRKHWFIAIIISIVGFILTIIATILQS